MKYKSSRTRALAFACIIMLVLFVLYTSFVRKNVLLAFDDSDAPYEIQEMMKLQEEALHSYELLWESFQKDNNGFPIYPREYGGEYIDEGLLYILLTSDESEIQYRYLSICNNADVIRFLKVENSINELQNCEKTVEQLLGEYRILSYGVDVINNKYRIEVLEQDYKRLLEDSRIDSSLISISIGLEANALAAVYGGDLISGSNGYDYSVCIGGTYSGYSCVLTAGHGCSSYPTFYRGGTTFGTTSYQRANTNSSSTGTAAYGDFAIVKVTGSFTTNNHVRSSGASTVAIGGIYSSIPVGTTIYKYGQTTGYAYGTVQFTNRTVSYSGQGNTYYIKGITQSAIRNASGSTALAAGDSGGSVYIIDGSTYKIHGLVSAGYHSSGVYYTLYSTPITYAIATGFTPKTN